jgi:hypothetical protein
MSLYGGIDLHANNSVVVLLNGNYPGRLMPPMQSAITALPRKG